MLVCDTIVHRSPLSTTSLVNVIVGDVDDIHQARDMVIIEVDRDYPHFDRILGEHRWSEFLRNLSDDEKERVTQVFYCTYHTGRMVQKNSKLPHFLFSGLESWVRYVPWL